MYDTTKPFGPWLGQVFKHALIDYCRKNYKNYNPVSEYADEQRIYDDIKDSRIDWRNGDLLQDIKRDIRLILQGYEPPEEKKLIEDLFIHGMEEKDLVVELVEKLNIKQKTAEKRIERARDKAILRLKVKYLSDYIK